MAQYTVEHSCGHTQVHVLFGPIKDRERKLDWLAEQKCSACWHEEQMEKIKTDDTPISIKVSLNTANLSDKNKIIINAVAVGGTYRRKEELKSLGFVFGDAPMSGLFGIFDKPQKAWYKIIKIETLDDLPAAIRFGDFEVVNAISEIDLAAMADKIKAVDAANRLEVEKKERIGQSPLSVWIAEKYGKPYWNGKIYGESGVKYGRPARVYLDNIEYEIPSDVYTAQVEWRKRRDEINAEGTGETK